MQMFDTFWIKIFLLYIFTCILEDHNGDQYFRSYFALDVNFLFTSTISGRSDHSYSEVYANI